MNNILSFTPRKRFASSVLLCAALSQLLWACGGGGDDGQGQDTPKAVYTNPQANAFQDLSKLGRATSPQVAYTNTTMRSSATVTVGANRYRVKLSNAFGSGDLVVSKVVVAAATSAAGVSDPATNVLASFAGASSVTIKAGEEVWSDPVQIKLSAGAGVIVSWFLAETVVASTGNVFGSVQVASGDQTTTASMSGASTVAFGYTLAAIDAYGTAIDKVVVAFGDSITAGTGGGGTSYPGDLQARFDQSPSLAGTVSVVNQGIPGNRIMFDGFGPSAVSRFDRDVLGVSGATHVILFMGINDIQLDAIYPNQVVTADQVIAALDGLVKKARSNGLQIFLGTITPFRGNPFYSETREAVRQAANTWIRGNTGVAGVFDFDVVMRSSADPTTLNPAYDSGDHTHPNAAGYAVMAGAIPLPQF